MYIYVYCTDLVLWHDYVLVTSLSKIRNKLNKECKTVLNWLLNEPQSPGLFKLFAYVTEAY